MKNKLIIGLLVLIYACRHENIKPLEESEPPFLSWGYTANVNVNGIDILKYINATKYLCDTSSLDSSLQMKMVSMDNQNYIYEMFITVPDSSGTYGIPILGACSTYVNAISLKSCCYPNPDAIMADYSMATNDSANNYIRIHVNAASQELSGIFKATMKRNFGSTVDPDTIKFRCDTFYCKYGSL